MGEDIGAITKMRVGAGIDRNKAANAHYITNTAAVPSGCS
jgi:hypothetical protein